MLHNQDERRHEVASNHASAFFFFFLGFSSPSSSCLRLPLDSLSSSLRCFFSFFDFTLGVPSSASSTSPRSNFRLNLDTEMPAASA